MERIPRKLKKAVKKRYFHRYGVKWLKCDNILVEYLWLFKNPLHYDTTKRIW